MEVLVEKILLVSSGISRYLCQCIHLPSSLKLVIVGEYSERFDKLSHLPFAETLTLPTIAS